jgi:hypothetical protein
MGDKTSPSRRTHLVQFFSTDAELVKCVSRYIFGGFCAGEGIIVIGIAAHNNAMVAELKNLEIEVEQAIRSRQLILLDAVEILKKIMDGPKPNRERFRTIVGSVLEEMIGSFQLVRAYGEMVDLLAANENLDGALQLEEFWNELGQVRSFSLLCGYSTQNFGRGADDRGMLKICGAHTYVVASPSNLLPLSGTATGTGGAGAGR